LPVFLVAHSRKKFKRCACEQRHSANNTNNSFSKGSYLHVHLRDGIVLEVFIINDIQHIIVVKQRPSLVSDHLRQERVFFLCPGPLVYTPFFNPFLVLVIIMSEKQIIIIIESHPIIRINGLGRTTTTLRCDRSGVSARLDVV
jgi:hypothetical protein